MQNIIVNGPHTPIVMIDDIPSPKSKKNWDNIDKRLGQLNIKVMNILYYALDANEFNKNFYTHVCKENFGQIRNHQG